MVNTLLVSKHLKYYYTYELIYLSSAYLVFAARILSAQFTSPASNLFVSGVLKIVYSVDFTQNRGYLLYHRMF